MADNDQNDKDDIYKDSPLGPIVSSAHLAVGGSPALSEVEFGLILAQHAFGRWIVRAMAAAGISDLSPLDVFVLHTVNHRQRSKKLADICLVLSVEDTHTVTYSIRKLEKLGLVESGRQGKEKTVRVTSKGEAACLRYREVRETLLVEPVLATGLPDARMKELASFLRALSGHYDQAARAATTL